MDGPGVGRRGAMLGGLASAVSGSARGEAVEAGAGHAAFRAALLPWLNSIAWRCGVRLSADVSDPDCTLLRVAGLHPAIWISLRGDWGIDVGADWDGECWDLLASFDVPAEQVAGGWENTMFVPEARVVRATREAVWREDVFETLLEWINDELIVATHLGLWGEPDHGTWA